MDNTGLQDKVVREHLLKLLRGGNAHMSLDYAVADFPPDAINKFPPKVVYTPWHLLEHIRISQRDIIDFIHDPNYVWLSFPEDYWPGREDVADEVQWHQTIQSIRDDLKELEQLVKNPATDLYSDLPQAKGYTILREVLVVTDHNAYHIGEFGILRQVMGTWPESHKN
jgi:hypothetical protein